MHVYAVREITSYLRELFESSPVLGDVWIAGEVSNASRPASGHVYFTLKDGDAQLKAVFFAKRTGPGTTTARLVKNGSAVVAHGRIALAGVQFSHYDGTEVGSCNPASLRALVCTGGSVTAP